MGFEHLGGEEVWEGRMIRVRVERFRHEDGGEVAREVAIHPGAAVVVAHDGEHVHLVTQPREAVGEEALLELPAGKIDQGEEPLAAARRELAEEIGMGAGSWELLKRCYASPGFSDETYHLYLATDLRRADASAEEEERIRLEAVRLTELDQAIERCVDAKSLVGLLLLRGRLSGGEA
ncbi:MAG TPA: NUDIX hydrolase [Thermoleophilaceae bacterium]|nr:NUDIX hydrolase [Thermoleophilaceae bacterium]